ncbi:DNA polymerase I [Kiritimatiellota bacterium B12222]|nr:DNA polymerase I [Kiritimatiellota bacterium B12222]
MSKVLYLLDGMALVYRAHFAFMTRPIVDSKGRNHSAVYGFTNTLLELLDSHNPSHIAVAFDTKAPTERHILYPEYKAQREAMPEDLALAIPEVKRLLAAMNIPMIEKDGYEADDIIGTLARKAEAQGYDEVYMVTPDKDYAQLVDAHTMMYKPGRKGGGAEILGIAEICEQWEIERTEQVIDILGLMGDASDNIPGVPGVGPKTAKKLIKEFGSVENLLENADKVKGKLSDKLKDNAEMAKLSRQLVEINCAVPLEFEPDDLTRKDRDDETLKAFLQEMEFNTIGKRLFGSVAAAKPDAAGAVQGDLFAVSDSGFEIANNLKTLADVPHDYRLIEKMEDVLELVARLTEASRCCFDLETESLDVLSTSLVGIAFSMEKGKGDYVAISAENQSEVLAALLPFWTNKKVLKIGHNLKFDLGVLLAQGIQVEGPFVDTMIAHALVDAEQRHGMDRLAASLLQYQPIPITDLIGPKGKGQKSMAELSASEVYEYAVEDADVTLQLWDKIYPMLQAGGQVDVFEKLEMPLLPVLMRMEHEGICLDSTSLAEISEELGKRLVVLESEIFELAGERFNMNSPKQLGVVLFEKMKLSDKPKKTKTGQYSTNEQVLQGYAGAHPIIDAILEFRELGKLKSTYVDALPKEVHAETGRVHTQYLQTGAATGRLSSNHPNLQNIPIRTERGKEIRKAFISRGEGFELLAADYSQVELRLMAHLSGDEGMCDAFRNGLDIHTATAAGVFDVALDEVTSDMRRKAKMVNFGIIYGISAFGLSQRLSIPREEASEIIKAYFAKYPGVNRFMGQIVEECREKGYVETMGGRRRKIRDIDSRNRTQREAAERTAINSPIQGSAADMIKQAMIDIDALLANGTWESRLLLQVHDELVFDLKTSEADELIPQIQSLMEKALPLSIPVEVDVGRGQNWLQAH